jgi:hypothetical protein
VIFLFCAKIRRNTAKVVRGEFHSPDHSAGWFVTAVTYTERKEMARNVKWRHNDVAAACALAAKANR